MKNRTSDPLDDHQAMGYHHSMAKKQPPTAFDLALAKTLETGDQAPILIQSARKPGSKEVVRIQPTKVETIRDTIIRIQQQADPIGFLINVMNGALVENIEVNPEMNDLGDEVLALKSYYTQATMLQRVQIARFLANKVLPSLSVQQHIVEPPSEDGPQMHYGAEGQPSFAQLVAAAASKAQAVAVNIAPRIVVEEPPEYDGIPVIPGSAGAGLELFSDEGEGEGAGGEGPQE